MLGRGAYLKLMVGAVYSGLIASVNSNRVDQNMGGAFLGFYMRTAMHGTSRVVPAISVCNNYQTFITVMSITAIARMG